MEPAEVTMGDAVTLKCLIAGTPDISVAWFKAEGKLRKSSTCSMDFAEGVATLKLTRTTKCDHSEYTCKAENRVGSASASCHVTVKGDALFLDFFSCTIILINASPSKTMDHKTSCDETSAYL